MSCDQENGKPVVRYFDLQSPVKVGQSALFRTIDHPSSRVTSKNLVETSVVISYDPEKKRIETRNTVYYPVLNESAI